MNHVRKHYQAFRKYTGNAITAYYDGGYIYVQGLPSDSKFKYIWVLAIYEDIEDAEDGDDIDEDEEHAIVLDGNFEVEKRMALTGRLEKASSGEAFDLAVNEFIIAKQDFGHMITVQVYVGEKLLDAYVADGLIISTPTGSTAYNLSAGGPVLEPGMGAIIITPICPHSFNKRSLVVSSESR